MTSNVMNESYKIYFSFESFKDCFMLILLMIFVLILLFMMIVTIGDILKYKKAQGFDREIVKNLELKEKSKLSSFVIIAILIVGLGIFSPISVTKTTQVLREKSSVVQVEGKLLSSKGLSLYLKNAQGEYFRKDVSIDGTFKIQEEGSSYKYETVTTRVTYRTRSFNPFKTLPDNQTEIQKIVTVPKGSIIQK
ncbi:hypothetical protein [Lactococcus lactis]|uniref:hypothetical protein n=1 Tax=Lactococcus lactis TaxID=1358 RepID=UPI0019129568|nr:hypothetical protein [Lactococcus lactis]WDA67402.1 hypothetical protein IL310_00630 [Lactococcus lactis]